jgi:hypothetical protein
VLILGTIGALEADTAGVHKLGRGCDETDCDRGAGSSRLKTSLVGGVVNFAIGSESGRRKEIVLDRLSFGFSESSSPSVNVDFLISGSLTSSFPYLSEAKYSSPRPNTT